jgi:hypothetical protein
MNISRKIVTGLLGGIAASLFIASAQAAPIVTPVGLSAGDTYRLAFVTSTTRDGLSPDIADYNAFVTAAANSQAVLASLGTTWSAVASTNDLTDARDNTDTNPASTGVAIYLLDGTSKIADNNADL